MARVLVLTPNTMLDHVAEAPFAQGAVNRVPQFTLAAGGKGLNVGRVLVRHGHQVIACGFAGGESGQHLRHLVAADGMEPCFTTTAARTRIGFAVSDPGGSTSAAIEGGFAVLPHELTGLVSDVESRLPGCDLVIGSGSVPDDRCRPLWRLVLVACHAAGIPCWIDSYGSAMHEALTSGHPPALAKPNREEYGQDRAWLHCPELHLTDGDKGLHIRHPKGRFRVVPPRITERNPIGSGDCYIAGLAHARLSGLGLSEQLRYAAAAGAANAARADVARIGPSDISALIDRVSVGPAEHEESNQ